MCCLNRQYVGHSPTAEHKRHANTIILLKGKHINSYYVYYVERITVCVGLYFTWNLSVKICPHIKNPETLFVLIL